MKYLRQGIEGEKLQEKKQLLKKAWDNFKGSGIVSYDQKKVDNFIDWHDGVTHDDLELYGKSLIDDALEELYSSDVFTDQGVTVLDITSISPLIEQLEVLGISKKTIAPFLIEGNKEDIKDVLINPLNGEDMLGKSIYLLLPGFIDDDGVVDSVDELGPDTYLVGLEGNDKKCIRERLSHDILGYVDSYTLIDEKYLLFEDLDLHQRTMYDMEAAKYFDIEEYEDYIKTTHPITGEVVHYDVTDLEFIEFGEKRAKKNLVQEIKEKIVSIKKSFRPLKDVKSYFDGTSISIYSKYPQLSKLERKIGAGREIYINLVGKNLDLSEIAIVDHKSISIEYIEINQPLFYSGESVHGFTYFDSPIENLQAKNEIRIGGFRDIANVKTTHMVTGDLIAPTRKVESEKELLEKRKYLANFYKDSGLFLTSEGGPLGRYCLFDAAGMNKKYLMQGNDYAYHSREKVLQLISEDTRGFYSLGGDEVAIADPGTYCFTGKGENLLYEKEGNLIEMSIADKKVLKTYKKWKEKDGFIFIDLPFSLLKIIIGEKSQRVIELKTGIEL